MSVGKRVQNFILHDPLHDAQSSEQGRQVNVRDLNGDEASGLIDASTRFEIETSNQSWNIRVLSELDHESNQLLDT